MIYSNCFKYEGEFKNDKRSGHGIMTFSGGDIMHYDGEWQDD